MKLRKKAKKTRGDMFYTFTGMTLLSLNAKLSNFTTLKSDQNVTKLCTALLLHTINKNVT